MAAERRYSDHHLVIATVLTGHEAQVLGLALASLAIRHCDLAGRDVAQISTKLGVGDTVQGIAETYRDALLRQIEQEKTG